MTVAKEMNAGYSKPKRLSFPVDDAIHPWLSILLDAYYIVDKGIAEAISIEEKRGKKLACGKGCSSCCKTHETIPVYPLELVGLSWYITEKISGPGREVLKKQLKYHKENDPCPLLVDGICSVHPMRPISCRQFNVFGKPCAEGEDPYYSRREDVLTPIKKYTDYAFFTMLPFYGVEKEPDRWKIIESGAVHQMVKLIQTCNWKSLTGKMDDFDRKISEDR
jgi:Fe-S-cluster containining protein